MDEYILRMVPKPLGCTYLTERSRMLHLGGEQPMASGSKRLIYTMPRNSELVLKIARKKNFAKRLRRLFRKSANAADAYWCRKIHGMIPDCAFVPRVLGFVCTDQGVALVEERIRNGDGTPALQPVEFIRRFGRLPAVRQAVEELFDFLARHHVVCNDISEQNILLRHHKHQIQAVVVDGFGDNHLIPYPSLSSRMNRRKLERKKERVLRKLVEATPADGMAQDPRKR